MDRKTILIDKNENPIKFDYCKKQKFLTRVSNFVNISLIINDDDYDEDVTQFKCGWPLVIQCCIEWAKNLNWITKTVMVLKF